MTKFSFEKYGEFLRFRKISILYSILYIEKLLQNNRCNVMTAIKNFLYIFDITKISLHKIYIYTNYFKKYPYRFQVPIDFRV